MWHECSLLTLCLILLSADNLRKHFGPRSGPAKLFDTVFIYSHMLANIGSDETAQMTTFARALSDRLYVISRKIRAVPYEHSRL